MLWSYDLKSNAVYKAYSNIVVHGLNSALALFEILFTHAGPAPWLHAPILVILAACYLGVAYITHATQGFYSESSSYSSPCTLSFRTVQPTRS